MSILDGIDFSDLRLFLTITRRRSFKAAAIELGVTPSAASHAMRRLEQRLGIKLLNRTSRAVVPTDLGLDLARNLGEGFERIGAALQTLEAPGAASFGELRINLFADAAYLLLAPALADFAAQCPDSRLAVVVDDRPIDIVAEGYDAGMRYGHHVPDDMIAIALTEPSRWVVVASPAYLARHGKPETPAELSGHRCLQLRLGDNSSYRWELGAGKEEQRIKVPGLITINDTATTISAAKAGLGLAYLLEDRIAEELLEGSLEIVLPQYASPSDPIHIYYGSRRHNHPALRTLINIIRRRNGLSPIR